MQKNGSNRTGNKTERYLIQLTFVLGILSYSVLLAYHNYSDSDMWAKLALGASVWLRGDFIRHDIFAFTPVLEKYIDHEWGAGFIWFGLLKFFGPKSLMILKIVLAVGSLWFAALIARRQDCSWPVILLAALPAGYAILPGFAPVIRSHTFTYIFFAFTLFALETMRNGGKWPPFVLVPLMVVWTNVHGGFVAGLGTISAYAGIQIVESWIKRKGGAAGSGAAGSPRIALWAGMTLACWLVTLVNPYGLEFWRYLLPALLHPRRDIAEWHALPLFGNDAFLGFRLLFLLVLVVIAAGWKHASRMSWGGMFMLALTAYLGWKSRRHAAFFGVAALAFATPFLEAIVKRCMQRFSTVPGPTVGDALPDNRSAVLRERMVLLVLLAYAAVFGVCAREGIIQKATIHPLAQVGDYPVREADILMWAKAEGNLAVPFAWGSYCVWRLFPGIKVSIDGRYETTYPEETFAMNRDFNDKLGEDWHRLLERYTVDYVILDYSRPLRPEDLAPHGFTLIWQSGNSSALLARDSKAAQLKTVVKNLSVETIDPLNAAIPQAWWK